MLVAWLVACLVGNLANCQRFHWRGWSKNNWDVKHLQHPPANINFGVKIALYNSTPPPSLPPCRPPPSSFTRARTHARTRARTHTHTHTHTHTQTHTHTHSERERERERERGGERERERERERANSIFSYICPRCLFLFTLPRDTFLEM